MDYIYQFDIAAIVIDAILLMFFYPKSNTIGVAGKSFKKMVIVSIITAAFDLITVLAGASCTERPLWYLYAVNAIYLCAQNFMPHAELAYVSRLIEVETKSNPNRVTRWITYLAYPVSAFIIISSPLLSLGFGFDENNVYHQGTLMPILYILAGSVMSTCLVFMVIYHKSIPVRKRVAIYVLILVNLLSMLVQSFVQELLITNFAISCAGLIMFVILQNPEQALDPKTGFLTRNALIVYFSEFFSKSRGFSIMLVKPDHIGKISVVLGPEIYRDLIKQMGSSISAILGAEPYIIEEDCLAYVVNKEYPTRAMAEKIFERFKENWQVEDSHINRTCSIAIIPCRPNDTTESILNALNYSVERLHDCPGGIVYEAQDEAYDLRSSKRIEEKLKRLEAESREATLAMEAAQKADYEKSMFLANMSHEIRTPMNAIIGMTDLILRDDINERVRVNVEDIKTASDSLLAIINDILDISKVESGNLKLINAEYNLRRMISEIVKLISTRINSARVKFIVEIDDSLPLKLIGDSLRVRQVLVNILGNATKFTEEGSITLRVGGEKYSGKYRLLVSVADTGTGIKEEDKSKLFKSFSRIENKGTHYIEGTGLGLALCQQLVKKMNGEIRVQSEFGVGSTFYFDMEQELVDDETVFDYPDKEEKAVIMLTGGNNNAKSQAVMKVLNELKFRCIECNGSRDVEEALAKYKVIAVFSYKDVYSSYAEWFSGSSRPVIALFPEPDVRYDDMPEVCLVSEPVYSLGIFKLLEGSEDLAVQDTLSAPQALVLVVDDNIVNLKVADGLLKCFDINAEMVTSGFEAIEKTKSKKYDIIFMDHMMPQMDGIEAMKKIREVVPGYASVPIVALTANSVNDAKNMFLSEGFDGFISKPIDMKELEKMLYEKLPNDLISHKTDKKADTDKKLQLPKMTGVDTAKGIGSCAGKVERYLEVLKIFYSSGKQQYERIKDLYKKRDEQGLRIEVHGLKSVSASIGAMDLSNTALSLENALKAGNMEFVDANLDGLLAFFDRLLKQLGAFFDNDDKAAEGHKEISLARVRDRLVLLAQTLSDFDDEQAVEIISGLLEYDFDRDVRKVIRQIRDIIEVFDYNKASEMTDELIEQLTQNGDKT